jgi:hypothetical protein
LVPLLLLLLPLVLASLPAAGASLLLLVAVLLLLVLVSGWMGRGVGRMLAAFLNSSRPSSCRQQQQ